MPKTTAPSTLSGHAAEIWESAYASAWKAYDSEKHTGDQEAYAAKTAWTAVKNAGYTKKDGEWIKTKAYGTQRLRLRITKARTDETGRTLWHAQAANDELDEGSNEVLDPSLFDDLAVSFSRIRAAYDNGEEAPLYWFGRAQEPILDLSHYSALLTTEERHRARLGSITKLYRDGRYLHAAGYFDNTELGRMAAENVKADKAGVIRCSVGFWPDWGNITVKDDVLRFMGGRGEAVLDHLAVTSVPRLPTTSIFAEEVTMSDTKVTTMAEDALAVLGKDGEKTVDALEELVTERLETKSMVCLAEGEESIPEVIETAEVPEEADLVTEAAVEDTVDEPIVESAGIEEEVVVVVQDVDTPVEDTPTDETPIEPESAELETTASDVVDEQDERTVEDAPISEEDDQEPEIKEKSAVIVGDTSDVETAVAAVVATGPYGGATSFEDARKHQEAVQEAWRLSDGWYVLQAVIDNIFETPTIDDKHAALTTAMTQYISFVKSNDSLWSAVVIPAVEKEPAIEECNGTCDIDPDVDNAAAALAALKSAVDSGDVGQAGVVDDTTSVETPAIPVEETPVQASVPVGNDVLPVANLDAEELAVMPGYQREATFSEILDGLVAKSPDRVPVQRRSRVPATPQPQEMKNRADVEIPPDAPLTPDLVETLVTRQVQQAMAPVLDKLSTQLQELRAAIAQPAVNAETETPQRPVRRSKSPVAPARVTTRARTFGEALDALRETR